MVGTTGFEPATFCSQSRRDTKLRYVPIMARLTRIELVTSWFVARHSIQLSYRRILLLEVPAGFEPAIIELQSIALPTWLRNHHVQRYELYHCTIISIKKQKLFFYYAAETRTHIASIAVWSSPKSFMTQQFNKTSSVGY